MANHVIQTEELTVYYGRQRGVLDVNMAVEAGEVFGFLGPNGAGKTTTQRVLLDIIRPTRGRAMIFGLDCQKDGVAIRQRVGYLPGELSLPGTMRGKQFLDMLDSVRDGKSDPAYRKMLCERLNLDTGRRIRDYSRGNKQKLGLVAVLMSRPALLVLDEPTSGLDPLVQQTVLELVREARQEGRTVFFSSHILPEVQAVCDRVGIIRDGRLIKVERVDALTAQPFHRVRFCFEQMPAAGTFTLEGVQELNRDDHTVVLEVRKNLPAVMERAAACQIVDIETQPVTLEEVFLAYYGSNGGNYA
ncbi:MAG: ABC transporter ATP-binding protein [Chloroflexi bacterium]|nr:ABC transporter ATP-binding protein [Chloroflexota bacterium]MCI0575121.1 ABC transporter ATP-binding protein [Chloroflexota bacterium]MCI0646270.1 ABC transporter ATP-binding protein [Chloroflexota bacterium]MCI0728615.1 ABC transporter ATP-binding protein [Chloroflexota bacterium]